MSDQDEEIQSSTPGSSGPQRASGGMGVSSERTGHTGPGQEATDGLRDSSRLHRSPEEETAPEQSTGGEETNPVGIPPKAGYSSKDPRSDDHAG